MCGVRDERGRPCLLDPHDDQVLHRSGKGDDVHFWPVTDADV